MKLTCVLIVAVLVLIGCQFITADDSNVTGPPCQGAWSDWSPCEGCSQRRNRTCTDSLQCIGVCHSNSQAVTRLCGNCSSTPSSTPSSTIQCKEYEKFNSCSRSRSRCQEKCMAYRTGSDSCVEEEDQCESHCECIDDYYRNVEGQCVPKESCECYPLGRNSSLPIGYQEDLGLCLVCMCLDKGYKCSTELDCCKREEWSDWTPCAGPCGLGTQNRTRNNHGNCGDVPAQETETIDCEKICECEDTYEQVKDCKLCKCVDGFIDCMPMCKEITDCNNRTHTTVPEPEQPCCQKCVEINEPCRMVEDHIVQLSYTDPFDDFCVSTNLTVHRCEGSCGINMDSVQYQFHDNKFFLVSADYNCQCCQAMTENKEETFKCVSGATKKLDILQVTGCSCWACGTGTAK